ncbi:MAG: glycoside hydrolase, partial [Bryobacteraceae bacterium]
DNNTVYAAINRIRVDDQKPHILRTHDGGSTWTEIVKGLPDGPINTVREDPVRKGLLFAGSELAVYFSIDDGDNWMPLRLNMPATSIRDLVVHNDDVVVGTHGRGFWILDDITPLRQISAQTATAPGMLFQPQIAVRVRRNVATDTPLPPEEPVGQNPPDGAILNYWLAKPAAGGLTIEILDPAGKLVRRYASDDKTPPVDPELNVPTYWLRTAKAPGTGAGMHRFLWDLRYAPPATLNFGYPISAIYGDTPREPLGPAVLPGAYTVRLTANGTSYTQPLQVRMDPRVTTPAADLEEQFQVSLRVYELIDKSFQTLQDVRKTKDPRAAAFDGAASRFRRGGGGDNFAALNGQLAGVLDVLQGADAAPTTQAAAAVRQLEERLNKLLAAWRELRGTLR